MNSRPFRMVLVNLAATLLVGVLPGLAAASPPNIVIILADDKDYFRPNSCQNRKNRKFFTDSGVDQIAANCVEPWRDNYILLQRLLCARLWDSHANEHVEIEA